MNKQALMTYSWFGAASYFVFATLVTTLLAIGGAAHIQETNPTAFDESFITFEMLWFMLSFQPILATGLFLSMFFMDLKFSLGIFKPSKKKEKKGDE